MKRRVGFGIGLLMLWAGCSFFSPAELSDMIPGMSKQMDKLECWLTITFKTYPDGIDHRDVQVKFTSMALEQPEVFDWEYIAAHDVISQGFMQGFKENPASVPEGRPPPERASHGEFSAARQAAYIHPRGNDRVGRRALLGRQKGRLPQPDHRARLRVMSGPAA